MKLGSVPISGANQWVLKEINVVPQDDIYAIAIGPDCVEVPMNFSTYYFFDKLVLAEERDFLFQVTARGHPCSDDFGLSIPYFDTLQYQWYRNGIALPGENGPEISTGGVDGDYQVRLLGPNSCRVAAVYRYRKPVSIEQVRRVICQGETFPFGGRNLSESGTYVDTLKTFANCDSIVRLNLQVIGQAADTVSARVFEGESWPVGGKNFSEPGAYDITLTSSYGCDSLVHLILDTYRVYFPNAFSPNDDGRNDLFTVYAGADIEEVLRLQVFNRWGGLMYESEGLKPGAPGTGWDGVAGGKPAPNGVYVYQAAILTSDGQEYRVSGEVVLVR